MSEQDKQEAKVLADRAATQGKQASRNAGRAAKAAAKVAAEEAGDVVEELNDAAENTVDAIGDAVRPAVKPGFRLVVSPLGKSVIGFAISVAAAIYATKQSTKMLEESTKK